MLTHIGTQTIETERLILRRFEYSDIDSMLRNWIADEQTQWDYGEPYYPMMFRSYLIRSILFLIPVKIIIAGQLLKRHPASV